MTNKTGILGGFVFGMAGFLLMFKLFVLDHTPPTDEIAPGIVVLASIFNGLLFAFAGQLIQNRFGKRTITAESE